MVSPRRGPYPHTEEGVEVRRIFHLLLRHRAIENLKTGTSRFSSMPTGRCLPRARPTRRASLWGRFWSTRWPCSTATKTPKDARKPTAGCEGLPQGRMRIYDRSSANKRTLYQQEGTMHPSTPL